MKSQIINFKILAWITVTMMTILFFACEKDDDPFKACRKNPDCEYFTCMVNGKQWEPQCDGGPLFGCTPWDVQYYRSSGYVEAVIKNEEFKTGFKLDLRNIKEVNKDYYFEIDSKYYNRNNNQNCVSYNISIQEFNVIRFEKIDTINKFIQAKFTFKTSNNCGDVITITDGEFNLPYRF